MLADYGGKDLWKKRVLSLIITLFLTLNSGLLQRFNASLILWGNWTTVNYYHGYEVFSVRNKVMIIVRITGVATFTEYADASYYTDISWPHVHENSSKTVHVWAVTCRYSVLQEQRITQASLSYSLTACSFWTWTITLVPARSTHYSWVCVCGWRRGGGGTCLIPRVTCGSCNM